MQAEDVVDGPTGPSLRGRAILAVALTAAFYALALTIGLGLIIAPAALMISVGKGNLWIVVVCAAAGLAVLRAIVPARDRFEAPGPELTRTGQPRLHEMLDEIAAGTGQPQIAHAFLDLQVNAGVAERRLPTSGRGRVLVLGLPLLASVSPAELKAILAHEFGHYAGGDTRFSVWIWRTRVAVLRSAETLANSESSFQRAIVRWPFELYARLFERLTARVSRRQEFAADAVAASIAGSAEQANALRRVSAVGAAFDPYWESEAAFALARGRRPPVAEGFQRFLGYRDIAEKLDEVVAADIEVSDSDVYASHPTLAQRIDALGEQREEPLTPVGETALVLLDDVPGLEAELLATVFGDELRGFSPIAWESIAELRVAQAGEVAEDFGALFEGVSLSAALSIAGDPVDSLCDAVRDVLAAKFDATPTREEVASFIETAVPMLCVHALARTGWEVVAPPGAPVVCERGSLRLVPYGTDPQEWTRQCEEAGVADVALIAGDR